MCASSFPPMGTGRMKPVSLALLAAVLAPGADWDRFRGPNGSGVSTASGLPTQFGPGRNEVWKTRLGLGHSSPVLAGDRIYVTGVEGEALLTYCLRAADGAVLWKRQAPRPRRDRFDKRNNAASPTPVAEAAHVYVFFPEFGLLSYTREGKERWRLPLGPFDNFYGMGASPILAGDLVVLVCDQTRNSFVIATGKDDGRVRWRQARPEAISGHSTPVLYRPAGGPLQILAPGSFRMDAYQAATGESLWHAGGLASEMKSVPVVDGDTVFINGYNLPENDPGRQVAVPEFGEMMRQDRNGNGRLEKDEAPEGRLRTFFAYLDLDHNGSVDGEEWRFYQQSMAAENGLLAIRAGGTIRWKYHRSIPQLPSTLLYQGILYMVGDNGVLTVLDPGTGAVSFQGRLRPVSDRIYASPVAAGGRLYFVTEAGVVVVRKPGAAHELLAVNELGEEVYATPAIGPGRLYVRTTQGLWAFGIR